ncbi:MAG: hypothetical protein WBK51_02390 [Polaromonas sp.]
MGVFDIFRSSIPSQRQVTAHLLDPKTGHTTQEWIVGKDVDAETIAQFAEDGNLYIAIAYRSGEPTLTVVNRAKWISARMEFDAIDLQISDSPSLRLLREFEKNQSK